MNNYPLYQHPKFEKQNDIPIPIYLKILRCDYEAFFNNLCMITFKKYNPRPSTVNTCKYVFTKHIFIR